ncbi:hypothetical protein pb186bvf_013699 [Paramecium bursaria]
MQNQIEIFKQIVTGQQLPQNIGSDIQKLKLQVYSAGDVQLSSNAIEFIIGAFSEVEVIYYLKIKSIPEFKLAIQRLITLYNNGVESVDKFQFFGIYLLYLLSYNKFAKYYAQIELLPKEAFNNDLINFVLRLEQELSIGDYSQLYQYKESGQAGLQSVFLERIIDTIRLQIALSANASYERLTVQDALLLLGIGNVNELRKFAFDQNFEWKFEGQYIYFNFKKKDENPLNSDFLIQKSLKYVGDLDSII